MPARGVAEQGISASMRARRSRSQHTQRWERGRPARQANYARKNLPSSASRERGTKGVRATRRAHPFTLALGKPPLPLRFCAEPMYPYQLLKVPPARRGNRVSAPLAVPLAKRGEPKGGGQFINSERAIGIISSPCAVASGASRRPIPQLEHDVQQKPIDDLQQPPHLSRPPSSREPARAASALLARAARIACVVVPLPLAHFAVNLPQVQEDIQPAQGDT